MGEGWVPLGPSIWPGAKKAGVGPGCGFWAGARAIIALSSSGAEYSDVARGASAPLGAPGLCKHPGVEMKGRVRTDSTAAKGVASRRGPGKARHKDTPCPWARERLPGGSFRSHKEDTHDNVGISLSII